MVIHNIIMNLLIPMDILNLTYCFNGQHELNVEAHKRKNLLSQAMRTNDYGTVDNIFKNNRIEVIHMKTKYIQDCITMNEFFQLTATENNLEMLKYLYNKIWESTKTPPNLSFLIIDAVRTCSKEYIQFVLNNSVMVYSYQTALTESFARKDLEIINVCLDKIDPDESAIYHLTRYLDIDDFSIVLDKYLLNKNKKTSLGFGDFFRLKISSTSIQTEKVMEQLLNNTNKITDRDFINITKMPYVIDSFMRQFDLSVIGNKLICYLKSNNSIRFTITKHFLSYLLHMKDYQLCEKILLWFASANYAVDAYSFVNLIGIRPLSNYMVAVLHTSNFDPDKFCENYYNKLFGGIIWNNDYIHKISPMLLQRLQSARFEEQTETFSKTYKKILINLKKNHHLLVDTVLADFVTSKDVNGIIAEYVGFLPSLVYQAEKN